MGLRNYQIETNFTQKNGLKPKTGFRKWLRNQRNRKIRRVKETEKPNIKYSGWEY
jgi:hypothetical protein